MSALSRWSRDASKSDIRLARLGGEQLQFCEQERVPGGWGHLRDEAGSEEPGSPLIVACGDLMGQHQQQIARDTRAIGAGRAQHRLDMGNGDGQDVPRAVDVQGDPADPSGPFVDELALGRWGGRGDPFGKLDGIEVAAVANEDG